MQPRPVFVAGVERSGTTLLYALLASHPSIAMTRRTNLWTYFYGQYGDLSRPKNLDRCIATMMQYKRLVVLGLDPDRLREEFLAGPATYGRLFALVEQQYADRVGKPRWGDKSLNTERYADPIFAAYPGARILHMIRDPRDRYASVRTRWHSRRGGVGAGAAEWLVSARLAERNVDRHPDRYLIVRYETLAAEPEATMARICAFIGEEYSPSVLSMQGARAFRQQGSNSSYGARQAGSISSDSVGRFRDVLTPRQIAFLQLTTARRMQTLGYDGRPEQVLTRGDRVKFVAADLPLQTALLVTWRLREQVRNYHGRPLPDYRLVPRTEAP